MIPFEFMVVITISWVLFGAIILMPHFAERKMTRKGGRIDTLEKGFNTRLDKISSYMALKFTGVESKLLHMPKIPDNIPDMNKITKLIEDGRENTVKVLEDVQLRLSTNMKAIDENIPVHITNGIKSMEGRMYRAKGINMQDHEKGIDAAKEVILHDIEDPGDKAPVMQIVRHFVQVAADAELIDRENADQKIGLVQGILEGIKMFQNRGNSNMGGSGLSLPGPSSPTSHGNGLEGYYR